MRYRLEKGGLHASGSVARREFKPPTTHLAERRHGLCDTMTGHDRARCSVTLVCWPFVQALASLDEAVGEESPSARCQAGRPERGLPDTRPSAVNTLIDVGGASCRRDAPCGWRIARESPAKLVQRHGTGGVQLR